MSSNTGTETVEAVSYGLAHEMKIDNFYVQNSKDYKSPTMVAVLPPKAPINTGPAETVDVMVFLKF